MMKKILFTYFLLLIFKTNHAQTTLVTSVHFDLDKYNITADAGAVLDSFVTANKTGTKIKLYGHTDIMAGYEYNDELSSKRTHAVKLYLVKKGFNTNDIIEEKGFGKRRPLNNNHGELEMYQNRRVEIISESKEVVKLMEEKIVVQEKSLTAKLSDTATKPGTAIVLKNLNFYGGTHVIVPSSLAVLIELLEVMKKNPTLKIGVEGHICCQQGDADGIDIETHTANLSENRAKEICTYLSKNGIATSRLLYKGFGHSSPLTPYPEKTEEERRANRRVEIKILSR